MSLWEANWVTPDGWAALFPADTKWTFPPGVIDRHSCVLVNICEVSQPEGQPSPDFPFMGNATMTIHNIVPHDDGTLLVRVEVGWPHPINARLQFFVVD